MKPLGRFDGPEIPAHVGQQAEAREPLHLDLDLEVFGRERVQSLTGLVPAPESRQHIGEHVAPDRIGGVVVHGALDRIHDLGKASLFAPQGVHLEIERHLRVGGLGRATQLERFESGGLRLGQPALEESEHGRDRRPNPTAGPAGQAPRPARSSSRARAAPRECPRARSVRGSDGRVPRTRARRHPPPPRLRSTRRRSASARGARPGSSSSSRGHPTRTPASPGCRDDARSRRLRGTWPSAVPAGGCPAAGPQPDVRAGERAGRCPREAGRRALPPAAAQSARHPTRGPRRICRRSRARPVRADPPSPLAWPLPPPPDTSPWQPACRPLVPEPRPARAAGRRWG